jgi:hypothetical protein
MSPNLLHVSCSGSAVDRGRVQGQLQIRLVSTHASSVDVSLSCSRSAVDRGRAQGQLQIRLVSTHASSVEMLTGEGVATDCGW